MYDLIEVLNLYVAINSFIKIKLKLIFLIQKFIFF